MFRLLIPIFLLSFSTSILFQNRIASASEVLTVSSAARIARTTINGLRARFEIVGPGTGTIEIIEDGVNLQISGSTESSRFFAAAENSSLNVQSVNSSAIGTLSLREFKLTGDLTALQGVKRLLLNDVTGPTTLHIGSSSSTAVPVTISLKDASDLSLNSTIPVGQLRADSMVDTDGVEDHLLAPAFGQIEVLGQMDAVTGKPAWVDQIPAHIRSTFYWTADHEEGDLSDWVMGGGPDAGGGIFNTGDSDVSAVASRLQFHSGVYAAKTDISGAINQNRAVRLMRWTPRPWYAGGDYFPGRAFFSTWIFLPTAYDPGSGGFWNIFQFKSHDINDISQPMWIVNLERNPIDGKMYPYIWDARNAQDFSPDVVQSVAVGQWVHLEVFYLSSPTNRGRIVLYQNGVKTWEIRNVRTVMPGADEAVVWGIGNYTNNITGDAVDGQATIFFDDAVVSGRPTHPWAIEP